MSFRRYPLAICRQTIVALVSLSGSRAFGAERFEGPRVGTQVTYEVRYQSKGYTDLRAAIGTSQDGTKRSRHDLLGTLEAVEVLTILKRRSTGGVTASVTFARPVVGIHVDARPQFEREREVAADLGKTVYFYLDANARLERTEFPTQYSSMARNFVRAILSTQQFVVPASHQIRPIWTTQETGATTPYFAQYRVLTSGTATRVSKTISSTRSNSAVSTPTTPTDVGIAARTVPQGSIEFSITKQGTIERLQGTFHEDIFIQDHAIAAQDTSLLAHIVSSTLLSRGELEAATRALSAQGDTLSASIPVEDGGTSEREKALQQQILGQDSAESLQHALVLLDHQGASRERQTSVYLQLKALFYLRPTSAEVFGKSLSTADLASPSTEIITTALAAIGSAEAQNALCSAIRSRANDSRALITLVPVLGSVRQPIRQVVALLEELAGSSSPDIRSVALLGLGAAANNLANQSADRSTAIVRELVNRLASSTSDDKANLLLALGNTGSETARTVILGQRADRSAAIRRAVSTALAGFKSADSDQALCEILRADEDSQVRAAAAQALAARNRVTFVKNALLSAAQQDKADNVRIASLFALTNLISKDQNVQQVIASVARSDTSEVVRQQATSLLEQLNSESHRPQAPNR